MSVNDRLPQASGGADSEMRPDGDAAELPVSVERFEALANAVIDYSIFRLDATGHVASWNAGAERIKGYSASEILGRHFSVFYPLDAVQRGWPDEELRRAQQAGRFEDEGWRLRKDGTRFWANVVITALKDEAGRLSGFLKITRDLTERKRHEETLRRSEERFRLLVEGVVDYAIFMLDTCGNVASWNAGAQRIKGYKPEEIIGRHFSIFYPPEDAAKPADELARAIAEGRVEDEGFRVRKDGSRFWANVVITALHDREGRLYGFGKVTRDMTQRRRVEALEESGRQTNEFLAMLSHELRNPLAPIRNAVTVMQLQGSSEPSLQWARDVIDRQVSQLTRLVDDLLDLGRITSGAITLKQEPLDMAVLIARAVEASRPLIDARKHTLAISLPHEPLRVDGDLTRLSQVIVNLLNNAAKYTPEGGRIWLEVTAEPDQAVVRVRDTGVGLHPELLPRVFDLFTQGARSLDRSEGGLGIGLTLVRRLVALHGGSVEASSEGPGKGSEFVVRLPRLGREAAAGDSSAGARPEPAGQAKPRRILVVDDHQDSAESMAMLLRSMGHEVRVADDGEAALGAADEFKPDIILLDIGLPGMNGFEVAERLRARPRMQGVTLVAVTGYGQDADRERSRESGFDHHLVKPVAPERLRQILERPRDGSVSVQRA